MGTMKRAEAKMDDTGLAADAIISGVRNITWDARQGCIRKASAHLGAPVFLHQNMTPPCALSCPKLLPSVKQKVII